jgi:hypothetical protein
MQNTSTPNVLWEREPGSLSLRRQGEESGISIQAVLFGAQSGCVRPGNGSQLGDMTDSAPVRGMSWKGEAA